MRGSTAVARVSTSVRPARVARSVLPTHEREPPHALPALRPAFRPPHRCRRRRGPVRRRARRPHPHGGQCARGRLQPREPVGRLLRRGPRDAQVAGVQGPRRRLGHPAALRLERGQHRQRGRTAPGPHPGRQALFGEPREVPGPGLGAHRLAGDGGRRRVVRLQGPGDGGPLGHHDRLHHQGRLRPDEAPEVVGPGRDPGGGPPDHPHRHRRLLQLHRHPAGPHRPPRRLQGVAAQRQPRGLLQLLGRHLRRHGPGRYGGQGRGPDAGPGPERGEDRGGRRPVHREPRGPRRRRAAPALSAEAAGTPPPDAGPRGRGRLAVFAAGSLLLGRRRNTSAS